MATRDAASWNGLDHPNVARPDDDVNGRSLSTLVAEGRVPIDRASHIIEHILAALGAGHRIGLVHGGLSLDNIVLVSTPTDADFAKLGGFGDAPRFVAPELRAGAAMNELGDLYALGCVGYTLISGAPPAEDHGETNVRDATPGVRVPFGLGEWISRLMAPSPRDRFQSADEARNALRRIYASRSMIRFGPRPVADAQSPNAQAIRDAVRQVVPAPPPEKSRLWLLLLIAVVAGGITIGVLLWLG